MKIDERNKKKLESLGRSRRKQSVFLMEAFTRLRAAANNVNVFRKKHNAKSNQKLADYERAIQRVYMEEKIEAQNMIRTANREKSAEELAFYAKFPVGK